jgi:hypothetical protein
MNQPFILKNLEIAIKGRSVCCFIGFALLNKGLFQIGKGHGTLFPF